MTRDIIDDEPQDRVVPSGFASDISRRSFMQVLGAGLLITVTEGVAPGQRRGERNEQPTRIAARVHINADGTFTVMTGKVEEGQGARAEITQAAAEELRVTADKICLVMADSALVPDDGRTAGSQTTPRTIPAVRQGTAAARRLLVKLAGEQWQAALDTLEVQNGTIANPATGQTLSYADLARSKDVAAAFEQAVPPDVTVTPVAEWKVLGTPVARPNSRDLVTGAHQYPSDIARPG
ncbi:MAG: molybdopterin cofactor-binding domain-containing protein, partial [Solirubrobacterales bacterium]